MVLGPVTSCWVEFTGWQLRPISSAIMTFFLYQGLDTGELCFQGSLNESYNISTEAMVRFREAKEAAATSFSSSCVRQIGERGQRDFKITTVPEDTSVVLTAMPVVRVMSSWKFVQNLPALWVSALLICLADPKVL